MSESRNQQVDMLIRFFNLQARTSYKVSNSINRNAVERALVRANDDIVKLKMYLREKAPQYKSSLQECFDAFVGEQPKQEQPTVEEQPKSTTTSTMDTTSAMDLIVKTVASVVAQTKREEIEKEIFSGIEQKVRDFVKSEYGTIERKIITVVDGKKVELEGSQHEKLETVIKFVANNEPVFLTGPAGSGKNVLCQQVAKALNLDFYFSNAVTQEYKITGFTDAMGVFHESQFYKAFKNGGLFMLDEMDASIPEVLVILNAAIANRYFDFPAPIGYVEAHPNFRVIAAGNTFGLGANYEYVGRNQLDMASLDRFAMVKIDYSENIEMSVSNGDRELVEFARDFRNAASMAGVRFLVSYRAIGRIAKLKDLLGVEETLKTCLIKSLDKDDINAILSNVKVNNSYTKAVRELVRG